MIFNIIKSIAIAIAISLGLAFSLNKVIGFWEVFVGAIIFQHTIAAMWKGYILSKNDKSIQEYSEILDDIIQTHTTTIKCPCGNIMPSIFPNPNEDIIIACDKCDNKLNIITTIETRLVATNFDVNAVFNDLIEKNNKNMEPSYNKDDEIL